MGPEPMSDKMNGLDAFRMKLNKASRELGGQKIRRLRRTFGEIMAIYEKLLQVASGLQGLCHEVPLESRFEHLDESIRAYSEAICNLHEKLTSYCQLIERMYGGDSLTGGVEETLAALERYVRYKVPGRISLRGKHAHSLRDDDRELSRLRMFRDWPRITGGPSDQFLENRYEAFRRSQADRLHADNQEIRKVLGHYFHRLSGLLFHEDDRPGLGWS